MHGRVFEERKKGHRRLMFRAPWLVIASVEAAACSSSLSLSSSTSFSKDGRRISVGDCALFKPPQDCPPFIGLIRLIIPENEGKLKLRVSWLYRPAELKLGKGILLEALPNEIFYSFHEDEIPAASLLHPCKVTFLPRGVELPSGISSFVCWRVYDVMNQCIWWLTDQDYIDERQQEVDTLLCKTRSEMHTTLPQGGRSPRSMNSPTTSQVKAGTDGMQSNSSFSSQAKGRKRERTDQSFDSVKRERPSRIDDGSSGFLRTESSLKSEIAKITEKGRLVDSEGVERLVQLMLPERNEKKTDLIGRSILASVIAATDKFDCLSRFVQLRGLPVFDEWLQEIHKGKIGDASSPKDNDRSVEDFLLILLRALDKLPVNLNALQTCKIGKSVNHLRSHKNSEIGKKARNLVDTWKKRVEAEMDAKSGSNQGASWPGRPRQSEVSHGSRHSGLSADATKTSVSHLHPSKSVSVKIPSDNSMKSATTSPSSTRSAPSPGTVVVNDGLQRNTGALHREVGLSRSFSSQRTATFEKVSQTTLPPEKTLDVSIAEGCSNKLIVKLPKRGRSPAQSVSGGSFEDQAAGNSRAPSPVPSEKQDQVDRNVKDMCNTYRANFSPDANTESSQNNDLKNVSTVSDEVAGSPSVNAGDELGKAVSGSSKVTEIVKPTSPTLGDDIKTGKRHGGTYSSMNALIESCIRDSEANACMAGADDVGMNLLATVAADEMSKSPVASPSVSRVSDSMMNDNSVSENHATVITNSLDGLPSEQAEAFAKDPTIVDNEQHVSSSGEQLVAVENVNDSKPGDLDENSDSEIEELQRLVDQCLESNENSDDVAPTAVHTSGIGKNLSDDSDSGVVSDLKTDVISETDRVADTMMRTGNSALSKCKAIGISKNADSLAAVHSHLDAVGDGQKEEKPKVILSSELVSKMGEVVSVLSEFAKGMSTANVDRSMTEKMSDDNDCGIVNDRKTDVTSVSDPASDTAERVETSVPAECKATDFGPKLDSLAVANSPSDVVGENKIEQKPPVVLSSEFVKKMGEDIPVSSGYSKGMAAYVDRLVTEKINDPGINYMNQTDKKKNKRVTACLDSAATNGEVEHVKASLKSTEVEKQCTTAIGPRVVSPKVAEDCRRPNGSRVSGADGDEVEECTSVAKDVPSVSASAGSEMEARIEFDLNEGFNGDDTRNGNSNNFSGSLSLTPTPIQPSRLPASITVAAAAKGAFVPRDDLLRNKATVGWRGSAATSAFRPAEPRKVQEVVSLSMNNVPPSDASITAGKQIKTFLDFDLNVPDERVLEDLASQRSANPTNSSGCLDLDLNRLDDPTDMNNYTISRGHRVDSSFQQANLSSGGRRDFDLNDGPAVDEVNVESTMVYSQNSRSGLTSQPMISGIRMNAENMASGFSSWFPAANNYSAMSIPQVLPERGDQPFPVITSNGPQRMVGPTSGVSSFTPDMYRGPVLLSSPAVSFPPTAFQFPGFPFGTSFPLSSANFSGASTPYMDSSSSGRLCFPPVNSQILGPGVAIPSNYPRPYVVNLSNGSSNGGVSDNNSAKWFRSGLDLNSGPIGLETDGRDEATLVQRQLSSSGSLPLKDDQARMYQMSGGARKRKEPDGGWDGYKQSSWQ